MARRSVSWPPTCFGPLLILLHLSTLASTTAFFAPAVADARSKQAQRSPPTWAKPNNGVDELNDHPSRREALRKALTLGPLISGALVTPVPLLSSAAAKNAKSRTLGYAVQRTEAEWSDLLTPTQYFILRNGKTESPFSSILEEEERPGKYVCAGCGTPLFDAKQKFHSGTGWPSFASPVMSTSDVSVSNVEMEGVSQIQYQLAGAEVRCQTCGGHLGDVFADGYLFPGTPAFATGKRYCIDGAALLFVPKEQRGGETDGELEIVRGDLPPRNGRRAPVFPG